MACPLCRTRSAKRWCPALRQDICAVCCGTKRLVEIQCPPNCGYLISARAHPPAVVRRQQDRDLSVIGPALDGLTTAERQLFLLLISTVGAHQGEALQAPTDVDAIDAVAALASTLETESRGVIYTHRPASVPAERLGSELRAVIEGLGKNQPSSFQLAAALALRRIELVAREANKLLGGGEGRAFLELAQRIGRHIGTPSSGSPAHDVASTPQGQAGPSIIVP